MRSVLVALAAQAIAATLVGTGTAMVAAGERRDGPPRPAVVAVREAAPVAPGGCPSCRPRGSGQPTGPGNDRARSAPVRLDIPAIGVHTAVTPLGLHPDGTVEVPPPERDAPAGWYRYLAAPGEVGPAVIVGHVDSARDGPAVFYRLGALRPGDTVSVRRADGVVAGFTVVDVVVYPKAAFPTAAVYGPADRPVLRLVTCGGTFDRDRGEYRDNVVAYAVLSGYSPAL
jgi:hypothetical protein